MNRYPVFGALFIALICHASADPGSQFGPTRHDKIKASYSDVVKALDIAKTLTEKKARTSGEIIKIYRAEEKIGALSRSSPHREDLKEIVSKCAAYVSANRSRFREVHDGWKGEENHFEPTAFWAEELRGVSPEAAEIREIEFDVKFKDLMRSFRHDDRAIGKDCATFYADIVRAEPTYSESYSKEEIASMAPSCAEQRDKFIRQRNALLKEYSDLPAAKKLSEIDPTEIVSEKYFGLC